ELALLLVRTDAPAERIALGERRLNVPIAVGLLADAWRWHIFGIGGDRKSPFPAHPGPVPIEFFPTARHRSTNRAVHERSPESSMPSIARKEHFRPAAKPEDVEMVEALVRASGVFNESEIRIARELVQENLARGS